MEDLINTERLVLRQLQDGDAEAMFYGWCNDPEVAKYVTWNPHVNIEETRAILNMWIKEYDNPNTFRYGITLKDKGTLIGSIDVVGYVDDCPEIGYSLGRKYWNKGYMTEACKAFIEVLKQAGFKKIVIEAEVANIGSNRVIEKCGFIFSHRETKKLDNSNKAKEVTVNWYYLNV